MRPKISVELGRRGVGGNVGASFGIEAAVTARAPPFPAFTGSGFVLGTCDSCQFLQGALSIKVEDLSLEIEVSSRPLREITLMDTLFV